MLVGHRAVGPLPAHARVRKFLVRELARPSNTFVLTPIVLHEFVHVITDARRFDPPVSMSEAIALARLYADASNVDCVPVDERAIVLAFDLIERNALGRRRIADTLFAASLLQHGVRELITCSPADFEAFGELRLTDPCAE